MRVKLDVKVQIIYIINILGECNYPCSLLRYIERYHKSSIHLCIIKHFVHRVNTLNRTIKNCTQQFYNVHVIRSA